MPDALSLLDDPPLRQADRIDRPRALGGRDRDAPDHRLPRPRSRQADALALHRVRGRRPHKPSARRSRDGLQGRPAGCDRRIRSNSSAPGWRARRWSSRSSAAPRRMRKFRNGSRCLSAGAATMNLVTAAHALGYAANWITEWYAYDPRILKAMGLADARAHRRLRAYRKAARPPEDRPRPPLSEIVTRYRAGLTAMFYDARKRRPRPAARSVQGHRGAAPDRLDHLDERSGRDQSRALFLFQRRLAAGPPIVMFSSEGHKDSVAFIEETGEFVCNLATWDLRDAMNKTSAPYRARRQRDGASRA